MWIYRTTKFEDRVAEYGLKNFVDQRALKIVGASTRAHASRIAKPYAGFLVTRTANYRLIGSVERRGDREVFVWFDVLKRGDSEYKNFPQYSQTIRSNQLDFNDLDRWIAQREADEIESNQPVPLPEDLISWLQPISWIFGDRDGDDLLVYETQKWVEDMEGLANHRYPIHELVVKLVEELGSSQVDASLEPKIGIGETFSVTVQKTDAKSLFLLGARDLRDRAEPPKSVPIGDHALPHARRAYPSWLLADREMWFEIQDGTAYNLALSPEEQHLLTRAAGRTAAHSELPMFINGQAGSGKSTMLAYIFAGLWKMKIDREATGEPLYITYNLQLLEKARQTTRRILNAHHETDQQYRGADIGGSFRGWHDFLISLLPKESIEAWSRSRRIDYNDFVIAWEGRTGKLPPLQQRVGRSYSPATLWYVIRSLIKGADAVGDLGPDDFEVELTRDERMIDRETYESIYSDVYKTWYEPALRENQLWDDQDLTRAALDALEKEDSPRTIAALVIDEAQDFTRRELRLITRMTVYSDYAIPHMGVGVRPPIILAGDPLQTLSPTGFRWSAVKAGIFEELEGLFGPEARQPIFTELLKNYRSSDSIVRLANAVQLWRAFLFALPDVRPQEAWSPEADVAIPERFNLDEIDETEFIRFASDTVLIVPCEEGGEVEYVRSDPTLKKMFPDASEMDPPATVFSAASIKGLEFEKVLLYKFGEAAELTWSPIRVGNDRDLNAEYFFNKLYVAMTRATHFLFVADSQDGESRLWEHLDGESVRELVARAREAGVVYFDENSVTGIEYSQADLAGVQEKNPRENAIKTKNYALETRSPRNMRRAAGAFRKAGERREADECEALALKFEGNLLDAGRKFKDAARHSEAWGCYWESRAWIDLESMAHLELHVPSTQIAAVRFVSTEHRRLDDLIRLSRTLSDADDTIDSMSETWSEVAEVMSSAANRLWESADTSGADIVAKGLNVLFGSGYVTVGPTCARYFQLAGNINQAKRILERGQASTPEVARMLFEIDGAPDGLVHLSKAGLGTEIRDAWLEAGRPTDDHWLEYVLPALSGTRFAGELCRLQLSLGRVEEAAKSFFLQSEFGPDTSTIVKDIVRNLGLQDLGLESKGFIEQFTEMGTGKLTKAELVQVLVLSLAESQERKAWRAIGQAELSEYREVVTFVFKILEGRNRKFEKLNWNYVPALGAVCEVAGFSKWAMQIYLRFAEAADRNLTDYCKRRFLLMADRVSEDKAVSAEDRSKARVESSRRADDWGINANQKAHKLLVSLGPPVDSASKSMPEPEGKFGAVEWDLRDTSLVLRFDDEEVFARATISLDGENHDAKGTVISTHTDGRIEIQAGKYRVTVSLDQEISLVIANEGESPRTVTVRARPSSTAGRAPQVRRAVGVGGRGGARSGSSPTRGDIRATELAAELGLTMRELMDTARSLRIRPRRSAESFSSNEAQQIRDVHPIRP